MQNEELQRAQLALEAARDRYLDLYEFAPLGYLTLSREGVIEEINVTGATLLGVAHKNLIGQRFAHFVASEDVSRWDAHFAQTLRQDGNHGCEIKLLLSNGVTLPFRLDCRRKVSDLDGVVRILFTDNTLAKAAEARVQMTLDELERSNAELSRFAYVASHDLQEPLNTVIRYTQWLERDLAPRLSDPEREILDFVVDGAHRLHDLVCGLLDYSRAGIQAAPFQKVEMSEVVGRVLESLQSSIADAHAEITVGKLPAVMADQRQMMTLMQNLISNAIKYHAEGKPVIIGIQGEERKDDVLFSVTDNGIGIDPAYKDSIFIIFKRLHTAQAYPGAGIGLALCMRIVERHYGAIWVEPALGGGCVFKFTLPKIGRLAD
jgi:signal transduction histidine kinase